MEAIDARITQDDIGPLYDHIYRLSPKSMGGCRGVRMSSRLEEHGFRVGIREYVQQLLFPSEVVLASKLRSPQNRAENQGDTH